jgi:hypothetical protein
MLILEPVDVTYVMWTETEAAGVGADTTTGGPGSATVTATTTATATTAATTATTTATAADATVTTPIASPVGSGTVAVTRGRVVVEARKLQAFLRQSDQAVVRQLIRIWQSALAA